MRLLLQLTSSKDCEYDLKYFHKLQGFIYNLLKGTEYSILHDKKGYKFFCFSNIFPIPKDRIIRRNETKKLLISSPDKLFIKIISEKLQEKIENKEKIYIGEYEFSVDKIETFQLKLSRNLKLTSATPIVIRIPQRNYKKYKIPIEFRNKPYIFWRPNYSFEAFLKQLEENLIKKYKEFYKTDLQNKEIFEGFKFLKGPIVNHV
ncbi:MAG: CRISPR-associated endoribonuclease Cas6, partial [Minisyncoccia bacterium]